MTMMIMYSDMIMRIMIMWMMIMYPAMMVMIMNREMMMHDYDHACKRETEQLQSKALMAGLSPLHLPAVPEHPPLEHEEICGPVNDRAQSPLIS